LPKNSSPQSPTIIALFRKRLKKQPITRAQALACIPVRNEAVRWERTATEEIRLDFELALKPFFISILNRFNHNRVVERPRRTLELDEFGSEVWELMDGTRTTADIITTFAAAHGISNQEAEHSITLFLRQLGKRGLVGLQAVPTSSTND
jgi:hypothetical protein